MMFLGFSVFPIVLILVQILITNAENHLEIDDWELIGSRSYQWKGSDHLRCKHWDKVAIRWHMLACDDEAHCQGGTNADFAKIAQNWTEMPIWRNAFTYVQVPGLEKKPTHLRFGLHGYDQRKIRVDSFSPLKIDVDWRWQIKKDGCNDFMIRMSAMSIINDKMRLKLEKFCRIFDRDKFVDCRNL